MRSKDESRKGIHNHWIVRIMVSAETPFRDIFMIFLLPSFSFAVTKNGFFLAVPFPALGQLAMLFA